MSGTCTICGNYVPVMGNVMWCDECIDEFLAGKESMDEFMDRKKKEAS